MAINVGLDIGTSAVRAAVVQTGKGLPVLKRYGQVSLPVGAVTAGEIAEPSTVRDALTQLWKTAKLPRKRVIVGIANQRVIVRRVDVPYMSEEELRESLGYRAGEYIPIPIEEAILDFVPLEEFATSEGEAMLSVLVIAAQRDMANEVLEVLSGVGVRPMAIDLQAFALVRSVIGVGLDLSDGARAIVNIGAGVTQVAIVRAGSVRFLRTVPIGGEAFTRTLAEALAVDFQEAERQKRKIGVTADGDPSTDPDKGRKALTREADTLIEEVRGSIDYYRAESSGDQVTGVLISGNGARLPHLANRLGKSLDLQVEPVRVDRGDTIKIGKLGMSEAEFAQIQPVLPVAVGLGLWSET
jgi:type IV pilus assembly protein PilM